MRIAPLQCWLRLGTGLLAAGLGLPGLAADAARSALALPVTAESIEVAALLDPRAAAWAGVPESPLLLNRTPPLYDGDPLDDGVRPLATARLVRVSGEDMVVRVHWSDSTADVVAEGVRYADAGSPHTYKLHTEEPGRFADACCLMVPVQRGPTDSFPPLLMGGPSNAVELYYWRAGEPPRKLSGHGRGSTATTPVPVQGKAARDGDGWTVTLAVPKVSKGTPISFAIWDGARQQRDGLKFYSLWYEVE